MKKKGREYFSPEHNSDRSKQDTIHPELELLDELERKWKETPVLEEEESSCTKKEILGTEERSY